MELVGEVRDGKGKLITGAAGIELTTPVRAGEEYRSFAVEQGRFRIGDLTSSSGPLKLRASARHFLEVTREVNLAKAKAWDCKSPPVVNFGGPPDSFGDASQYALRSIDLTSLPPQPDSQTLSKKKLEFLQLGAALTSATPLELAECAGVMSVNAAGLPPGAKVDFWLTALQYGIHSVQELGHPSAIGLYLGSSNALAGGTAAFEARLNDNYLLDVRAYDGEFEIWGVVEVDDARSQIVPEPVLGTCRRDPLKVNFRISSMAGSEA